MYSEYEIRQLPLSIPRYRRMVETFLADNALRLDEVDYYAGVFRLDDDQLLAGGGLAANVIKCIAVSSSLRDEGMSNRLVSHLISEANNRGYKSVKLFTKPENRAVFESLSFRLLAEAPKAILMETGTGGLDTYVAYLRSRANRFEEYGQTLSHPYTGVVVMNANPFTRGHYYLLRQAAMQVDTLFVIVVKEDRSLFSYAERKAMIEAGTRDLQNVVVLEGSDYAISAATFPTYFLKQLSDASDTQMTLDLDLFSRHIAPALGATMRFVGSEPSDPLTARYNSLMRQQLYPKIEVVEIKRAQQDDTPITATMLRQHLAQGSLHDAAALAVDTTVPYLVAHLASQALQQELDTTPKPGLVDKDDSGAHRDMDYSLMSLSVKAIHPFFVQLALLGFQDAMPQANAIRAIGLAAEKAMLEATHGVNTHKGALFSMGLSIVAASHALYALCKDNRPSLVSLTMLQQNIIRLASHFSAPSGTHGCLVVTRHDVQGALASAQQGYPSLFDKWLPFFSQHIADPFVCHKTLLLIMSQIDDTNIIYRTDIDTAHHVKDEALRLLDNFSLTALQELNQSFVSRNISPGGAADMLSLTIFVHSMTH